MLMAFFLRELLPTVTVITFTTQQIVYSHLVCLSAGVDCIHGRVSEQTCPLLLKVLFSAPVLCTLEKSAESLHM